MKSALTCLIFICIYTSCTKKIENPPTPITSQLFSLGKYISNSEVDPTCPAGYKCYGYEIEAPGVTNNEHGYLAVAPFQNTAKGLIVFFTGGGGEEWWSKSNNSPQYQLAEELRALGYMIVQVRWKVNWLISSPGNDAGAAHLASRPATVIKYIYDEFYKPLNIPKQKGKSGFCITGNSGGSSQCAYTLAFYGLDNIVDVAVLTGGPPHSALNKSCMNRPLEQGYWYTPDHRILTDEGFGFFDRNGPAIRSDSSFVPRWSMASISSGGNDYFHPDTRINFLIGSNDLAMQTISKDYYQKLQAAGNSLLSYAIIPNTGHPVQGTPEGRAAMKSAILE